jgi:hypothetical protein
VSIAFSHHEERALHGIDDGPPKEKRRSRLREQRDELLAEVKRLNERLGDHCDQLPGTDELIVRIEGK